MMNRRKLISAGCLFASAGFVGLFTDANYFLGKFFDRIPADNKSLIQVVTIRSLNTEYRSIDELRGDWNNLVGSCNLSFSELCDFRKKGAFLFEERKLLNTRTLQTVRVWRTEEDFRLWEKSEQRITMKMLLESNRHFHLVEESIQS